MSQITDIGTVYVVSTPIGNLGDISFRAVDILKSVPLIAAEDTRKTKILLNHYNISTPLISYYEHNHFSRIDKIIDHLQDCKNIAVVTDAGTPGVSDPAYKLVREAIAIGAKIESIPGASATLAALISSGLPTDRFIFEGFLPPKKGRKKRLLALEQETATIIFFENPKRIKRILNDILENIGNRPAVVCRELTKLYEEIIRGTVDELLAYFSKHEVRGECVLLIGKDDKNVRFK